MHKTPWVGYPGSFPVQVIIQGFGVPELVDVVVENRGRENRVLISVPLSIYQYPYASLKKATEQGNLYIIF